MPYARTTLGDLKTSLAARLSDTARTFYRDDTGELAGYIREALRVWNTLTRFWRETGEFTTEANTAFYDLATKLPTLRGYTVTDTELMREIQSHLTEPATGTSWTGTDQFSFDQVTAAMQRRRDQFLFETGIVQARVPVNVPSTPIGRVPLPQTTIDVRRAVWKPNTGNRVLLWREDEWGLDSFANSWLAAPGVPEVFSVAVTPPIQLQLAAPPADNGTLELVVVQTGATLNPVAGVLIGVPDDFVWGIKWGALADLLGGDGPATDPARVEYCETRWQQAVELARLAASVLTFRVNGLVKDKVSLAELDTYNRGWEDVPGAPEAIGLASVDLVALSPVPDAQYGVTLDLVRKAPVLVVDTDYVQMGNEELEGVLDYAEHVATFKEGGAEFDATAGLLQRFLRLAGVRNTKLNAAAWFREALEGNARSEEEQRPRVEA